MKVKTFHCPICEHCSKPILGRGLIFWGNVNIIDNSKEGADGGGIIGWNFPPTRDPKDTGAGVLLSRIQEHVKKSPYHVECFMEIVKKHADEIEVMSHDT